MVLKDSGFVPLPISLCTSLAGRPGLAPTVRSFGALESRRGADILVFA
jgi:hypothetical protein